MSQRQTALVRLHEELRNIDVFDRIHDYAPSSNPASDLAYVARQLRRKQIQDEVAKLKASESQPGRPAWVGSAAVFVWAVGYAMLYFLFK